MQCIRFFFWAQHTAFYVINIKNHHKTETNSISQCYENNLEAIIYAPLVEHLACYVNVTGV